MVNQFSRVAGNERCSFFGNVSLGSHGVSLSELRQLYDVVGFAILLFLGCDCLHATCLILCLTGMC